MAALTCGRFLDHTDIDCSFGFHVRTAEKSFTAIAASRQEQQQWVAELSEAIGECQTALGCVVLESILGCHALLFA